MTQRRSSWRLRNSGNAKESSTRDSIPTRGGSSRGSRGRCSSHRSSRWNKGLRILCGREPGVLSRNAAGMVQTPGNKPSWGGGKRRATDCRTQNNAGTCAQLMDCKRYGLRKMDERSWLGIHLHPMMMYYVLYMYEVSVRVRQVWAQVLLFDNRGIKRPSPKLLGCFVRFTFILVDPWLVSRESLEIWPIYDMGKETRFGSQATERAEPGAYTASTGSRSSGSTFLFTPAPVGR